MHVNESVNMCKYERDYKNKLSQYSKRTSKMRKERVKSKKNMKIKQQRTQPFIYDITTEVACERQQQPSN